MSYIEKINEELARAFSSNRCLEMPPEFLNTKLPPLSPALRGYLEFHR